MGTVGFVIAYSNTGEIECQGLYLGPGCTVNDAKAEGLRQGVKRVIALLDQGHLPPRPIRVLGDS